MKYKIDFNITTEIEVEDGINNIDLDIKVKDAISKVFEEEIFDKQGSGDKFFTVKKLG